MKSIFVVLIMTCLSLAYGSERFKSAVRLKGQSYLDIMSQLENRGKKSVLGNKSAFKDLDFSEITEWRSSELLWERFVMLRDKRFLATSKKPDFKRRSSWLYPDDGCYARAALMIKNLKTVKIKMPWKIFIFGDLEFLTENSETGSVSWWYHVAPIVNVDGEQFVLDPALSPLEPIKLEKWIGSLTDSIQDIGFALCSPNSYTPGSDCIEFEEQDSKEVIKDQKNFLGSEWRRQEQLGRDPNKVLGDFPLWEVKERR